MNGTRRLIRTVLAVAVLVAASCALPARGRAAVTFESSVTPGHLLNVSEAAVNERDRSLWLTTWWQHAICRVTLDRPAIRCRTFAGQALQARAPAAFAETTPFPGGVAAFGTGAAVALGSADERPGSERFAIVDRDFHARVLRVAIARPYAVDVPLMTALFAAGPYLWQRYDGSTRLLRVDVARGISTSIDLPSAIFAIATSGDFVYAARRASIDEIGTSSLAVRRHLLSGRTPVALAVADDTIWYATDDGRIGSLRAGRIAESRIPVRRVTDTIVRDTIVRERRRRDGTHLELPRTIVPISGTCAWYLIHREISLFRAGRGRVATQSVPAVLGPPEIVPGERGTAWMISSSRVARLRAPEQSLCGVAQR